MHLDRIPLLLGKRALRVVIETPRGSRNKFDFDSKLNVISLAKTLPEGLVFPFDFGFFPSTRGEDGDPLDVLVLMDEPASPGCLVECRLVGVIEAEQREESGKRERNDRFIAVAKTSLKYREIRNPRDLPPHILEQSEQFFVSYNRMEGKRFKPLGLNGPGRAMRLIKAQRVGSA